MQPVGKPGNEIRSRLASHKMETKAESNLQQELHSAIEKWREVWKRGNIDEVLQLYTEDVRVTRSGIGLIVGREQLKPTLQHFGDMGLLDITFFSDEIGGISGQRGEGSLAYQRYHEALVREDGSEISTVYGLMIWKKVSGSWLIDQFVNCSVPADPTNTVNLLMSIQQIFDKLGQAWASHNLEQAMEVYSDNCSIMLPGEKLQGKPAVRNWLEKVFSKEWGRLCVNIENVVPIADLYIVSQLVHVTYPSLTIQDSSGRAVVTGSGNAIVKRVGNGWQICEAVWTWS